MVINKKIKRTMMESKSQYLGSLVLIILSCLLFTMFNLLSTNMEGLTSSFQRDYKQEDASFITDKKLRNLEELEAKFNVSMEETGSFDYSVSKDKTLRIFSENTKVNIPAIIEGKALNGNDILIDPAYAKANKLSNGDSIEINNMDFKVAGFMSLPNYIYPLRTQSDIMNDPNNFGIAVIGKKDFNSLSRGNSFYAIRFNGEKGKLEDRMSSLKDYLKNENIIVLSWINVSDNTRVSYVTAKIQGINSMSTAAPIAILILTCILTGIVMWRMLKRESVIIGTLYALGYKKREIKLHYLMYPLLVSAIGGVLGTLLGMMLLKPMLKFMVSYFNMPVGSINYDIKYIAESILLPIIFLTAFGYIVVSISLKNSPVDLMRGGKKNNKVGFIERRVKLDRFKFNTKFKIREQLRSITRSTFLLLGIIMATMLLTAGFAIKNSMDYLMNDSFNQSFKYNYQYIFNSIQQGEPEAGEAFSEIPFTSKEDDKLTFSIYGVSSGSKYISFKDKEGNALTSNSVIITKPLADKLNLKAGSTIKLINKLDSREYSITIEGVAETFVGQYIYIPLDKLNSMLKLPQNSYMGLWSMDKLSIPESRLLAEVTVNDMKNAFNSIIQPLQAALGIMAFMAFLIGLLVIYVVTSLTIEENKENISLMKVLGYRKKEVYSLILNSSTFIVVLGYIIGVPMLLKSLNALFKSVTEDMSFSMPIIINYAFVLLGFVIIYLTYEISKFLSRRKVNRISMAESLKRGD